MSSLVGSVNTLLLTLLCRVRIRRSIYTLTRSEITRGLANRFVHSRSYICLYLGMAALSVTTVVLSLRDGCPGLAFYILEVIINTSMILEVGIRFIAFGKVCAISNLSSHSAEPSVAILEISIQCSRPYTDSVLRPYIVGAGIC